MKIIESDGLRLLVPESEDSVIYDVKANMYHEKIYLGKFDTIENYREMHKSLQPGYDASKDYKNVIDKQEQAIAYLTEQLAMLMNQLNSTDN